MEERASKIGKELEQFAKEFLPYLKWKEICSNMEIKCTRSSHKKRTHGIDLLFKFRNPYMNANQSVIVECKNRQMKSFTEDGIVTWVDELINNIECSQSAPELEDYDVDDAPINTGLLLIHANDRFDKEKFYNYLSKIQNKNRRNPINIFIAGNDKINQWKSMFEKIHSHYNKNFKFLYPSINNSSKELMDTLTIGGMYSKYIFAQSTYQEGSEAEGSIKFLVQSIMFFFDEICVENIKYAWSMFKHYQMQGVVRCVFVFYPRKKGDVEFVRERFMSILKSVSNPISDDEKIKIDFIDNRELSSIETGGSI